jgi:hypothetical protein
MKPTFCARLQGDSWKVSWETILTIDIPNNVRQRRSMVGWEATVINGASKSENGSEKDSNIEAVGQ